MEAMIIQSAGVQDRDGVTGVLRFARLRFQLLPHVFADGGIAGQKLRNILKSSGDRTIEVIKRSDTAKGI